MKSEAFVRRAPSLLCVSMVVFAVVLGSAGRLFGQTVYSQSQFRRTVDPSERSASGTVLISKQGTKQTVQVMIGGLGENSFGVFLSDSSTLTTNILVGSVGPLDRTSAKKGAWLRKSVGVNEAPLDYFNLEVDDVSELAGKSLLIASPGDMNVESGVTNIVGNVTNIIYGIPLPIPGSTNTVFATLWAPLTTLASSYSGQNFSATASLLRPSGGAPQPSPNAVGFVRIKFNAAQGRSILEVQARSLVRGQVYSVFIADSTGESPVLIDAGQMTLNVNGSKATFVADTLFGDPLPQQVVDVGNLVGRVIVIADEFYNFHLVGVIPAP